MSQNKIGPLVSAQLIMEQEGPTNYCLWMNVRGCACVSECVCVYADSQAAIAATVGMQSCSAQLQPTEARSFT